MLRAIVTATLVSIATLVVLVVVAVVVPVLLEVLLYPGMMVVATLNGVWPAIGSDRVDAVVVATAIELIVVWVTAFCITLMRRRRAFSEQ